MRIPWPLRPRRTNASATPGLPEVVDGVVVVDDAGAASFRCNLEPEEVANGSVRLLSWLQDEDRRRLARLPSEAYTGVLLERGGGRGDIYVANDDFFEFMQCAMAEIGPESPGLQQAVRDGHQAGHQHLFIFDARNDALFRENPEKMPANDEIFGMFLIGDGPATPASYQRNSLYSHWSALGPTRIPTEFYDKLVARLVALDAARGARPN